MGLGTFLLALCLVTSAAAVITYIVSAGEKKRLPLARGLYYAMTAGVVAASVYLMVLILRQRYDIEYVWSYTSTDLPMLYRVSAFWAGQEGSFLLWALLSALMGVVLSVRSKDYEPWLMAFWSSVQVFFFTLLLVKSPFVRTPAEALANVPGGQELNPLLQNFWMSIHPPLVFVGYAAMAVPAAFVVAALINKDYKTWSNRCLPWTLFGWVTLGAGIILGSYWAYEVFGWGGYWGWDPVENASLIPWLAGTALVHGMLMERYRGSMRRWNIGLALLTFLLVIYATYLTRSGALDKFSVHTFGDSGTGAYLIGFMALFAAISFGLYVWRGIESQSEPWFVRLKSKDTAFFAAIAGVSTLAGIVLLFTSMPIITKILGRVSDVKTGYYNIFGAPIALALLVVLSLVPLLSWARRTEDETNEADRGAVAIFWLLGVWLVLAAALYWWKGLSVSARFAIGAVALTALVTNALQAWKTGRRNWKTLGGQLAHVGVALMFIGIVFCPSNPDAARGTRLELPLNGKPVAGLGYWFSFQGVAHVSDKVHELRIEALGKGKNIAARPSIRIMDDGGRLYTPYIAKSWLGDLYIEPGEMKSLEIEPVLFFDPHGNKYRNAMTPDNVADVQLTAVQVGDKSRTATLVVRQPGQEPAALVIAKGQSQRVGKYTFTLDSFDVHGMEKPGEGMEIGALLRVNYPGAAPAWVISVSEKPLIGLLWLGSLFALAGGCIAIIRRTGENKRILKAATDKTAAARRGKGRVRARKG